ncbi:MAG: glycosyltransferase family 4 protein [Chloroflexi bacterium]|nr:glycosyltransferase family 4 protein [Chloroflexota bacterium]
MTNQKRRRVIMLITPVDDNDSLFAIAQKDIKVLCAVSEQVTVVSGCIPEWVPLPDNCTVIDFHLKLHYVKQRSPLILSIVSQILKIIYIQVRMSAEIASRRRDADVVLCYLGYHFLIPAVIAKALGLKLISGAWGVSDNAIRNYGKVSGLALKFGLDFVYLISDLIIVQSIAIAEHPFLRRWKSKMRLGAQFFGNENQFPTRVPVDKRDKVVGFVGRLSPEKGIVEFAKAIPLIVKVERGARFEIIGRGTCEEEVRALTAEPDVKDYVTLHGQVANRELADYYNRIRLLVIPSFSEGLPNVLLEAISTGTPVLATPVGAIPEILEEGVTGFILKANSPSEIARRILELLGEPEQLRMVTHKARTTLDEKYSFAAALERFRAILDSV